MAQDIKKLLQQATEQPSQLSARHEAQFSKKLETAFSSSEVNTTATSSIHWMKIAAVAIAFIAVSIFGYYSLSGNEEGIQVADTTTNTNTTNEVVASTIKQIRLGDLSPDLKKVEDYYLTGINVQLASLEINEDNKGMIDGFLKQLNDLNTEYTVLNTELNEMGPSEATVGALIDNLKLRLELLFKLKNKLKQLKNQNNEQITYIQA